MKYDNAKRCARRRGVAFLLTFEEWLSWWKATGHYHERGNRKHQYQMTRRGDQGPYALDNIVCKTCQENSIEGFLNKNPEARAKYLARKAANLRFR